MQNDATQTGGEEPTSGWRIQVEQLNPFVSRPTHRLHWRLPQPKHGPHECWQAAVAGREGHYQAGLLEVLETIHCGEDGYIGFLNKDAHGRFQNLTSIRSKEAEATIPSLKDYLTREAYFTVHGMYREGFGKSRVLPDAPQVARREEDLRYLNACFVDLDCGRVEGDKPNTLKVHQVMAQLEELIENKTIPHPSIITRSGRGIYLWWLLHEASTPSQGKAWMDERLKLCKDINRAAAARLEHLAADKGVFDGARVLRVPGTIHAKTGQPAKYYIQRDDSGAALRYSLAELTDCFCPEEYCSEELSVDEDYKTIKPKAHRETKPASAAGINHGDLALRKYHLSDILKIEKYHEGWEKKKRQRALWLYTCFLKNDGSTREEAAKKVKAMAARCRPPYPSEANDKPTEGIANDAYRINVSRFTFKTTTLIEAFSVTPKMARELELRTIMPPKVKTEREAAKTGAVEEKRIKRHAAIAKHIKKHGIVSSRDMEKHLKSIGIKCGQRTINTDFQQLGIAKDHRSRRAFNNPIAMPK